MPRSEHKFFINKLDQLTIRSRLKLLMKPDPYAGPDGTYVIRSIYFDNFDDKELYEKAAGVSMREKWRIRYYNGDTSVIKLERKTKRNNRYYKKSQRITLEQAQALLAGENDFLLEGDNPFFHEFHAKLEAQALKPRTIVEYTREAYVYSPGKIRINFDTDIKTGLSSVRFFDPNVPLVSAIDSRGIVLEVKYGGYFPDHLSKALWSGTRLAEAISKYEYARAFEFTK